MFACHHSQELPGFEYEPSESEAKFVTTGFARNAVLGVAGEVVKAVQEGHLKHIFLIGGCDGSGESAGTAGNEQKTLLVSCKLSCLLPACPLISPAAPCPCPLPLCRARAQVFWACG